MYCACRLCSGERTPPPPPLGPHAGRYIHASHHKWGGKSHLLEVNCSGQPTAWTILLYDRPLACTEGQQAIRAGEVITLIHKEIDGFLAGGGPALGGGVHEAVVQADDQGNCHVRRICQSSRRDSVRARFWPIWLWQLSGGVGLISPTIPGYRLFAAGGISGHLVLLPKHGLE